MASIDVLLPLVRRHVQKCPDFTIKFALNHVARQFCDDTYYLKRTIELPIVIGTGYYDLTLSAYPEEEIIAVKNAEFQKKPLGFVASERVPVETGFPPRSLIFYPPATIELVPTPDESTTDTISIETVSKPILDSAVIPDELIRKYDRCLANGAISYLYTMPNEGWTNYPGAVAFDNMYKSDMLNAKSEQMFGMVHRNVLMAPRRFLI